jgi:hypothetical protein
MKGEEFINRRSQGQLSADSEGSGRFRIEVNGSPDSSHQLTPLPMKWCYSPPKKYNFGLIVPKNNITPMVKQTTFSFLEIYV